jgi:hypothetical protein
MLGDHEKKHFGEDRRHFLSSASLRLRACRRESCTRDNSLPPRCGAGWLPGYAYIRSGMHACMHERQSKSRSHRRSNQQPRSSITTSQPCGPCRGYDYYHVLRERRVWRVRHGAIGVNSDWHGMVQRTSLLAWCGYDAENPPKGAAHVFSNVGLASPSVSSPGQSPKMNLIHPRT